MRRIKLEIAHEWREHDGGVMTNALESPFIDATLTIDGVAYKCILRPYGDIRQPTRFETEPPSDARYLLDWAVRNGYDRIVDYESDDTILDAALLDEIKQEFEEEVINSEEFELDSVTA